MQEITKQPKLYMTMNSINLSNKVNQDTIELYELIEKTATRLGLVFMVVGATARDLILESAYDIPPYRATIDIDLGVSLRNWEQFDFLKKALINTTKFKQTGSPHTIIYNNTHPIDIIPFGDVSEGKETISWPPEYSTLMNVAGFNDAYECCISVTLRLEPLLEIKVISLANLVVLKLLAWKERGVENNKDAKDIATIIQNYGTPVNELRLFDTEPDMLLEEDGDLELAGACLLGHDISNSIKSDLSEKILSILVNETSAEGNQRLATQMTDRLSKVDFERQMSFLKKLKAGLRERNSPL